MMKTTDLMRAAPRGDSHTAKQYILVAPNTKHQAEVNRFSDTIFHYGPLSGLDPAPIFGLFCEETANATNYWWDNYLNGGSIGIEGSASDYNTPKFKNGADAALALLVDLAARAFDGQLPTVLKPYASLDFHLPEYLAAHYPKGTFRTWGDLSGRRATDLGYAANIAAIVNRIWPNLPAASKTPQPLPAGVRA